jgi:hypothetical protein
MTNHVVRLYVAAASIVVLFLAWAVIAAHPWPSKPAADPRLIALAAHQRAYRQEVALVKTLLARKQAAAAAAPATTAQPAVRVVTLPPLTITRVS